MKGHFMKGYFMKAYKNIFLEFGYKEAEIESRLENIFHEIFYGADKFYYDAPDDMGYVIDTGNYDVRSEGMSYAMMLALQMNKKELFDRLWKWSKTYMYMDSGENKGYFAWSVSPKGVKNAYGPAPDGEEYFALALFFAGNRWGNGHGIFNYTKEATAILHEMVHKEKLPMFNSKNKLILFIPGAEFTDPSYHLPHFYELFAKWSYEENFFKEAAAASREYLKKACHSKTGLAPEYSYFDGTPWNENNANHNLFYSDSYRVAANLGLDSQWFGVDEELSKIAFNIQKFFCETENPDFVFETDGTPVTDKSKLVHEIDDVHKGVLHPVGLIATNAQATLASGDNQYSRSCVDKFWNTTLRTGERRYYDNFLYAFAFLALSGNYKIYS